MSLRAAIPLSRRTLPAFAAEGVCWGAFAAYTPQIKHHIGASDAEYGFALLFGAIGGITAMALAPRFDRLMGRRAMALAALILIAAFQPTIWTGSLAFFALFMVFTGAAAGLLDVVMNARLAGIEAKSGASLMNLNHAVFSFAYAGAALSTGLARDAGVSVSTSFAMLALVVLGLAVAAIQRELPKGRVAPPATLQRTGAVAFWGGGIILVGFLAEQATEAWSALHVERTLGGGAAEGAMGPAMLGLTMGVGRLAGQFATARLNEARIVTLAALLSAAGALTAALAPTPAVAYLGFGLLGLGVSVIAPMCFALIGRLSPPEARATAISRAAMVGYAGFFIGPPLMGGLSQAFSLPMAFVAVAILLALCPLLLLPLRATKSN